MGDRVTRSATGKSRKRKRAEGMHSWDAIGDDILDESDDERMYDELFPGHQEGKAFDLANVQLEADDDGGECERKIK
jgi:hypothetical protein